jgi:hypothetical protein
VQKLAPSVTAGLFVQRIATCWAVTRLTQPVLKYHFTNLVAHLNLVRTTAPALDRHTTHVVLFRGGKALAATNCRHHAVTIEQYNIEGHGQPIDYSDAAASWIDFSESSHPPSTAAT